MTYQQYSQQPVQQRPAQQQLEDSFYTKVIGWTFISFAAMALSALLIGPLIPRALMTPIYLVTLGALIAAAFIRKNSAKLSGIFAVVLPAVLGVMLYSTLESFISAGAGNIVGLAAAGTLVIFGSMAAWGWTSKKSLNHLSNKLFFGLLGIIAVSLLNAFFFHLSGLSLVISIASLAIFTIYTFIDIQRVRDGSSSGRPASAYALDLFLDVYNIFVNLLNILSFFRD